MGQNPSPDVGTAAGAADAQSAVASEVRSRTQAPYGSWRSPITADVMLQSAVRLGEVRLDAGTVYWVEERPDERGRGVVVCRTKDVAADVDITPPYELGQPYFDVRTAVYSYGGGGWMVDDGVVYFSNRIDGGLYRQESGSQTAVALTPLERRPGGGRPLRCYADGCLDRLRNRWLGVREDWSSIVEDSPEERKRQPVHAIVAVDLATPNAGTEILSGQDFYAAPRLSPDGRWLAFLSWSHPRMPWQGTELQIVELDGSGLPCAAPIDVAGNQSISICQPEWSPDGTELWFVSDESGWWNLYRWSLSRKTAVAVAPRDAEFSQPQWTLATSSYGFASNDRVVAAYGQNGLMKLAAIDIATGRCSDLDLPFTSFSSVRADANGAVVFVAGASRTASSVVALDLDRGSTRVLKAASQIAEDASISRHFSTSEPITYPTSNGQHAHALFYPPCNADFIGSPTELPPVVVICHGGPTAQASTVLSLNIQYWTSRGIAVLDVNHRGSSGFGRAYRNLLERSWGIVEVEDCIAGVQFLSRSGRVDIDRAVIKGGSAGGFTTLSALTFHNFFKAGSSHYGIGDLEILARDTHKFESHYLDWLIGPYPEQQDVYRQRSPRHHVDRLSTPIIFFQGADDPVVPPVQAEQMVEAIKAKGLPFGYILFAGEEHGFRQRQNLRRAIEAEHDFFSFLVFQTKMMQG